MNLIYDMCLEIALLELLPHLPEANELIFTCDEILQIYSKYFQTNKAHAEALSMPARDDISPAHYLLTLYLVYMSSYHDHDIHHVFTLYLVHISLWHMTFIYWHYLVHISLMAWPWHLEMLPWGANCHCMFGKCTDSNQSGHYFADDIFKFILLDANDYVSIQISLKFSHKGLINSISALVHVIVWFLTSHY